MGVFTCVECGKSIPLQESFRSITALDGNFSVLFCQECAINLNGKAGNLGPIKMGKIDMINTGTPYETTGAAPEAPAAAPEHKAEKWKRLLK